MSTQVSDGNLFDYGRAVDVCAIDSLDVEILVAIAGKKGCPRAKAIVSAAFSEEVSEEYGVTLESAEIVKLMHFASVVLWERAKKNQSKKLYLKYKKLNLKISKLRDALEKDDLLPHLLTAEIVRATKKVPSDTGSEIFYKKVLHDLDILQKSCFRLSQDMIANTSERGRPSLREFENYILACAKLFEKVSGEKFSILRHKNNEGQYSSITNGHRFAEHCTRLLNRHADVQIKNLKFYTYNNLLNTCEKTVRALSSN